MQKFCLLFIAFSIMLLTGCQTITAPLVGNKSNHRTFLENSNNQKNFEKARQYIDSLGGNLLAISDDEDPNKISLHVYLPRNINENEQKNIEKQLAKILKIPVSLRRMLLRENIM